MRTAILLGLLCATPASAQIRTPTPDPVVPGRERVSERERIAIANVGLTSLFAVARGVAEGRVRSVRDGAEVAAWGAVAGAGFYAAKDQVGRGRGALGVGLAFASASLAENAAVGDGLLGHVRAGFGPLDLRVRTPLASRAGPALAVEVDPLGLAALAAVPLSGGRPVVRGGTLVYVHPGLLPEPRPDGRTLGRTVGRVVVVSDAADEQVVRHETIHLVQAVQASAVTPYGTLGRAWPAARATSRGGAVRWDLRADWLTAALGGLSLVLAGDGQPWPEVEAYQLDSPPDPPSGGGFFPTPCLPRPPDVLCDAP